MKFMIKTFCSAKTEMANMTFEYIILLMINNKNPEIISCIPELRASDSSLTHQDIFNSIVHITAHPTFCDKTLVQIWSNTKPFILR